MDMHSERVQGLRIVTMPSCRLTFSSLAEYCVALVAKVSYDSAVKWFVWCRVAEARVSAASCAHARIGARQRPQATHRSSRLSAQTAYLFTRVGDILFISHERLREKIIPADSRETIREFPSHCRCSDVPCSPYEFPGSYTRMCGACVPVVSVWACVSSFVCACACMKNNSSCIWFTRRLLPCTNLLHDRTRS